MKAFSRKNKAWEEKKEAWEEMKAYKGYLHSLARKINYDLPLDEMDRLNLGENEGATLRLCDFIIGLYESWTESANRAVKKQGLSELKQMYATRATIYTYIQKKER